MESISITSKILVESDYNFKMVQLACINDTPKAILDIL